MSGFATRAEIGASRHAFAANIELLLEYAGERRQTGARSDEDPFDVPAFNKSETGRDTDPAYDCRYAGFASDFAACIWLAFYVMVALHFLAFGN